MTAATRGYDLVLANDRQYSNTPWTYYQYIFQLPILDNQTTVNYERFSSQKAWNLTQLLDKTPTTNTKAYQAVMSKLQTTFMQNLPAIPLWYNGMWAMFNTHALDELAVSKDRAVHAHCLEELLADDEHRHAHASQAGHGHARPKARPMIEQHPSRRSSGRGVVDSAGRSDWDVQCGATSSVRSPSTS